MTQGLIALDIDGTVTTEGQCVPVEVIDYLSALVVQGWQIAFITGRIFAFAAQVLKKIDFPYYLAVNNGATIVRMPDRLAVSGRYLDSGIFSAMEAICENEKTDFVVYGGFEHDDVCYYRPGHFSKELLDYVQKRTAAYHENWHAVPSFATLNSTTFAAVKCFGTEESIARIVSRIEGELGLHVPPVRDPFAPQYYIAQATHPAVYKGGALAEIKKLLKIDKRVIAGGDDNNDHSMLLEADVRIVMSTAPVDLLEIADIIAPAAMEHGIISGLKQAIGGL